MLKYVFLSKRYKHWNLRQNVIVISLFFWLNEKERGKREIIMFRPSGRWSRGQTAWLRMWRPLQELAEAKDQGR